VSYGASQRTREMGIRLALGADPSVVRALVLRQGAVLVAGGIVCGLLVAAGVTRALSRFFFLVGSTDVMTFAVVTALLGAIALVACYLPARRAMRVDPMIALRHE
jgi:ABC-type antimicrobial peptide transport system permease subunit